MENYLKGKREECARHVLVLFVASPSAEDSTWEERSPSRDMRQYDWFEEWKDGKVKNRGADYKELKQAFIESVLQVVMDVFPKISRDEVEYVDAGTPITNTHYLGSPRGEIYEADHGIDRFTSELNATVRAQTPLRNLYLTGQDVMLCGFPGALAGALSCGSAILTHNLHLDAIALAKKTKSADARLEGE